MTRPRRSELATPASNERMLAKASVSGADLVFLDLEDAVAPGEKQAARHKAVAALTGLEWGRTARAIRMNGLDTPWAYEDVIEVVTGARDALDVIIVPKVRQARDVWWVEVLLDQVEARIGMSKKIGLEVLIEETEGLVNVDEIAKSSSRLEAIVFGVGDFSASQGARVDANFAPVTPYPGDIWHYARARIVVAARAAGIDAIDAPHPDFRDLDGFKAACARASAMGYAGKWAIHPSQLPMTNEEFTPTPDELGFAKRILGAYQSAVSEGLGATSIEGSLIDAAHLRLAANITKKAELLGLHPPKEG